MDNQNNLQSSESLIDNMRRTLAVLNKNVEISNEYNKFFGTREFEKKMFELH